MTNNAFLQKVFEAQPGNWAIQVLCGARGWRDAVHQDGDMIPEYAGLTCISVRLRPILPDNLTYPPEQAFLYGPERGGFPLGYGLARGYQRFGTISAWVFRLPELGWERFGAFFNLTNTYYILDVSDPNSRAMLEHNGLWPGDGEPEANEPDLAGMLQRDITKLETAGMELAEAAALGNNCHHRTVRLQGKLVVVGDSARKAHELGPDREVALENRFGGSAGYRLDFYERGKTVEIHIRGGEVRVICQRRD